MSWCIGGGIFFLALGMFLFWKPDLVWKLTEEWKSNVQMSRLSSI